LFYRGSVLANLLPVEVVTKTGSLSTLSLSQTVPARTTTQLVSLALITKNLEARIEEEESQPSNKKNKRTQADLLTSPKN
jgi:hypothetical protein